MLIAMQSESQIQTGGICEAYRIAKKKKQNPNHVKYSVKDFILLKQEPRIDINENLRKRNHNNVNNI